MQHEIDVENELNRVVDDLAMRVLPHLRGAAALIETSDAFRDGDELPSALILVADCVRDLADLQVRAEAALVRYTEERRTGVLTFLEAKPVPAPMAAARDGRALGTVQVPRVSPPGMASPSSS